MTDIINTIDTSCPKILIGVLLVELGMQKQSQRMTLSNARSLSSEENLVKAIKKNQQEIDYLLSLLKS